MQVAPSTYYANKTRTPSARAQRDAMMQPVITQLWDDNYRVYGARKLWKAARRAGHDIGRDQVARLMRELGIVGVRRGKRVRTTHGIPIWWAGTSPRPRPTSCGSPTDVRADLGRPACSARCRAARF